MTTFVLEQPVARRSQARRKPSVWRDEETLADRTFEHVRSRIAEYCARAQEKRWSRKRNRYADLDEYLHPFDGYKPLWQTEEFNAVFSVYKNGEMPERRREARDILVHCNIRLVLKWAMTRVERGLPMVDLMQEGVLGLMRALELFDPAVGYRFSTYASWWIKQRMDHAIADMGEIRPFRIPVHTQEKMSLVKRAVARFTHAHGLAPQPLEVLQMVLMMQDEMRQNRLAAGKPVAAEDARPITLATVKECLQLLQQGCIYIDHAPAEGGDDAPETMHGVIEFQKAAKVATIAIARAHYEHFRRGLASVESLVAELPEREAMIIRFRTGLCDFPVTTLEEIAEREHITRERIRQLEVRGIALLRERGMQINDVDGLRELVERVQHIREVAES